MHPGASPSVHETTAASFDWSIGCCVGPCITLPSRIVFAAGTITDSTGRLCSACVRPDAGHTCIIGQCCLWGVSLHAADRRSSICHRIRRYGGATVHPAR